MKAPPFPLAPDEMRVKALRDTIRELEGLTIISPLYASDSGLTYHVSTGASSPLLAVTVYTGVSVYTSSTLPGQ